METFPVVAEWIVEMMIFCAITHLTNSVITEFLTCKPSITADVMWEGKFLRSMDCNDLFPCWRWDNTVASSNYKGIQTNKGSVCLLIIIKAKNINHNKGINQSHWAIQTNCCISSETSIWLSLQKSIIAERILILQSMNPGDGHVYLSTIRPPLPHVGCRKFFLFKIWETAVKI